MMNKYLETKLILVYFVEHQIGKKLMKIKELQNFQSVAI